jgi:hypothetical protein
MSYHNLTNFPAGENHHSCNPCPLRCVIGKQLRIQPDETVSVLGYLGQVEESVRGSCLRPGDRVPYDGSVFEMRGPPAFAGSLIVLWEVVSCRN